VPDLKGFELALYLITAFIQIFVFVFGGYYIFISFFGWSNKKTNTEPKETKMHRFAMLVAAHNEEMVIANMVKSLQNLNYPREYYDIFVIADNCDDATAERAREAGALVYERTNDKLRGKGYALEWMFEKIFEMGDKYDSISIFDADNVVNKNYLYEMNKELNKGYEVVQGVIDSKNPFDSWITCAYSVSFWSISRMFQNARYNLGMTCQLSGTGFVVSTKLLKEIGWGATCLTEDMEFTAKLALMGKKVGWAHKAVVYDEKPLTFKQSWHQRIRWMQGHADVASRFTRKLFKRAFKERDFSAFDCAIYLLQPVKVVALLFATIFGFGQLFGIFDMFDMSHLFGSKELWSIIGVMQMFYIPFIVTYEKRIINGHLIWSYLIYGFYSLTWIPITIIGWCKKNHKEWSHTKHTRQITIDELEKIQ